MKCPDYHGVTNTSLNNSVDVNENSESYIFSVKNFNSVNFFSSSRIYTNARSSGSIENPNSCTLAKSYPSKNVKYNTGLKYFQRM